MEFTPFQALQRLAHRVAVSEEERIALEQAFLTSHGSADEKARFAVESDSAKQTRESKERFDAAVAAEVQRRQDEKQAAESVSAAADAAQAAPA